MKKIEVRTGSKCYPIYYGANVYTRITKLIEEHKLYKNVFVIVDSKVNALHRDKIALLYNKSFSKIHLLEINSSENNKSSKTVEAIYNELIKMNYGRDTLIVAIGGGIVGDIAAFAASTFARGVQIVHVPTTLLACIDSSIGGKTGINFGNTKNLIGTFYQPEFVLADKNFLLTLNTEEKVCGIGEAVKYAFISNIDFYTYLYSNATKIIDGSQKYIDKTIETCGAIKASIVSSDETEQGLRKILNLGHTFAHAIEVEQNYKIKHGQAVVIGTVCSLYLSFELGLISKTKLEKLLTLPLMMQNVVMLDKLNTAKVLVVMQRDKKNINGRIKFVLVQDIGKIIIDIEAEKELVIKALEKGVSHFI